MELHARTERGAGRTAVQRHRGTCGRRRRLRAARYADTPRCRGMPPRRRRRGSTSSTRSRSSTRGRYPAKRTVGDLVEVSRRRLPRRPREAPRGRRCTAPPASRKWREAELHPLDAHHNGVRWGGSFVVDQPGPLGVRRSRPGPTSSPPGATSCAASSRPASTTWRAS